MKKNDVMLKSARRKPLRDVSNGGGGFRLSKSSAKSMKKNKNKFSHDHHHDNSLDLLLLSHSRLSSLLRKIDELVVQAVKMKANDNKRNEEIRYFSNVLSEAHSSLKPSVLRLEEALAVPYIEPESQSKSTASIVPTAHDEGDEAGTPEPTKKDSLVSPSPLVSWRATECLIERGKQLFLLTPLPRPKTSISKIHASSKLNAFKGISLSTTLQDSPLSAQATEPNHDNSKLTAKAVQSSSVVNFASPPKISMGDHPTVLATPCLKLPPNSCVLLEPDCIRSEKPHMSTPYPVENQKLCESNDSENSSGEVKLGLKYPELIGIKHSYMLGNGTKALEASPAWIMSPPKCCTLLEPLDEKAAKDVKALETDFKQKVCLAPRMKSSIKPNDQDPEGKSLRGQENQMKNLTVVESTPMWKESESTIIRGKHPGENTLKKELWTKFEAASMGGVCLNFCAFEDTSHKGFLDRLEEASCDEERLHTDSLR